MQGMSKSEPENDGENENGKYCVILILSSLPHILKIQVTISNKKGKEE